VANEEGVVRYVGVCWFAEHEPGDADRISDQRTKRMCASRWSGSSS
jgi:hypothetical protein